MKPLLFALTVAAIACSCTTQKPIYPVLRVRDYDPNNNRVTDDGLLLRWTNWGVGFWQGTNWIKIFEASEK